MATRMMLRQEATPAQIGAFMIAHRIKRPTSQELAGMLDAYLDLGPQLQPVQAAYPVTVLCSPYDGRSRTAPLSPLTALILATAGVPVLLHGGRRMPTKEGLPLIHLWQELGVNWPQLSLEQVQQVLVTMNLGFVYLPRHFPLAEALVPYREQIGKRPPLATLELMWSPYRGPAHLVCGFVHPPTETLLREALALHGQYHITTVKGLEGSCDLPRDRTVIIGLGQPGEPPTFERLHLHPREFAFAAKEVPLMARADLGVAMVQVLSGSDGDLSRATIWNAGFYLWRCGVVLDLATGFDYATELLRSGKVATQWHALQGAIATA